jgi:uracil-DNA glycosylase
VKHFRFEMRGKRRIHRKPSMAQVSACRPWLEAEVAIVRPEILVPMGAVAAQAFLGRSFKVTEHRGEIVDAPDLVPRVVPTVHPASILRAQDGRGREAQREAFIRDLRIVARMARAAA